MNYETNYMSQINFMQSNYSNTNFIRFELLKLKAHEK